MENSPGFTVGSTQFYNTEFSTEWTGYIYLTKGTTYYFQLYSDDGSLLYINTASGSSTISASDLRINDANINPTGYGIGIQPATYGTSTAVTVGSTGWYPIEVDYYQTCDSQSGIDLLWSTTSATSGFTIIPTYVFVPAQIGSNAAPTSPTLTTSFTTPSPITTGTSDSDQAIISGQLTPKGTVAFYYFGTSACKGTGTKEGSKSVSGDGTYGPSTSVTYSTPGTYYWDAVYTPSGEGGDCGGGSKTVTSACESLVVTPSMASPTISTAFTNTAPTAGMSDTDTATLSGATSPTGAVTFYT